LKPELVAYAEQVDALLGSWIGSLDVAPRLRDAMHYSVFNGGKRFRPALVLAAANTIDKANTLSLIAAASVECLHAYSLIHDDLPAMDDDDLRRGKPTCHIQFDEATAILAGDALQALAFEKLAEAVSDLSAGSVNSAAMVAVLAQSVGANGMVGGQMLDLQAEGQQQALTLDQLQTIHRCKTGALIKSSVLLGAMSVGARREDIARLSEYAECLGLAFQVQDDVLDVVSDTETLGKAQGSDVSNDKSTFVSLLGLDASKNKAEGLVVQAKRALEGIQGSSSALEKIADLCVSRNS